VNWGKVGEFINFLPVLAYDGSTMRQVNAAEILDIAMAGTSATLLAKRWESALLVNVDNDTLARLLASEEAMDAMMRIEGFRSLNADIETIINWCKTHSDCRKHKTGYRRYISPIICSAYTDCTGSEKASYKN
jgi:putative type III restriction system endonuclease